MAAATPSTPVRDPCHRGPVTYDEALGDRVRDALAGLAGSWEGPLQLRERRMFGGLAFLVQDRMAVAVSGQGGLMVRAAPAVLDGLLAHDGVARVEMRGRPMTGWLRVAPDRLEDDEDLDRWVAVGIDAVRGLA
ncbi:MAG: uncharacterized protein JWR20_71 [Marmoricola sp.]|nr:uncharacterized protein [Marmoricola sp.]